MTKVVGVRFRQVGKIYFFAPGQYNVEVGQHVIVETARGIEYGHVVLGEREVEDSAVVQPLKAIIRISTPDDDEGLFWWSGKRTYDGAGGRACMR